MNSSPIEDVLIGGNKKEEKKAKGLKVVIFILFLLLVVLAGAYWYFLHATEEETAKEAFLKNIKRNNINYLLENELYKEIRNKIGSSSFEMTSNISFSTTKEEEYIEGFDENKISIDINFAKDMSNSKTETELGIKYSDNDLIKANMITTEDFTAIMSDEIVSGYVGARKENFSSVFEEMTGMSINTNYENALGKITENTINMNSDFKREKLSKYFLLATDLISEENFLKEENILITKGTNQINTTEYTLNLTQTELNGVLNELFTELKSDTDLLSELVTGEDSSFEDAAFDISTGVGFDLVSSIENTNFEIGNRPDLNTVSEEDVEDYYDLAEEDESLEIISTLIISMISGTKMDTSVENLTNAIDSYINNINNLTGEGLVVKIYVSDVGTEKMGITFPDVSTVDIEYDSKSEIENTIKITYIGDEEVSIWDDEISEYTTETQKNGYSIEIYKLKKDASTTFKISLNNIEENEINKKTIIDLVTKGTMTSKKYTNNLIITYSDSEGKITTTIDNTLNFDSVSNIEDLNEDNCLFIDNLPDEEAVQTIEAINQRIKEVFESKQENLDFIDTNIQPSVVEQKPKEVNENKENAKNMLIETVSNMMGQALDNEEEFGLNDLQDIEIEGHIVSSIINEDLATITIDGYKFYIDANFNLTEHE